MLTISKIIHKDKIRIKVAFDYDEIIIQKLKTLRTARYSKTMKAWHLEYSQKEYNALKSLFLGFDQIDYFGTTSFIKPTCDNTNIEPEGSNSVISSNDDHSNGDSKNADIQEELSDIEIEFHNLKFYIKFKYNPVIVSFVRKLDVAYWSKKHRVWQVKASKYNLKSLQKQYNYWNEDDYSKLLEIIKMNNDPRAVEIYKTPDNPKNIWIKLKGYNIDVDFMKHISERNYDKRFKRWSIPNEKVHIDRIIEHYESQGVKVTNRLPEDFRNYQKKYISYGEKQKYFINKFNGKYRSLVSECSDVMISQRYSWSTIQSYIGAIVKFATYLRDKDLPEATSYDVNKYLAQISSTKISDSLLNSIINAIKFYYTKVLFIPDFEIDKIKRPRKGLYLPQILSKKEVERILKSLNNIKHVTLLYTLYSGGMRLAEILNLRVNDISFDRNQILIKAGKGKKDRVVMLSNTLKEMLILYTEKYKPVYWLFEGQDRKSQYSDTSVRCVVKSATRKAKINKRVTPHTLRHCFATHLLDGGTNIRYIQELLGHKSIKTTLIYTHVTTDRTTQIQSPLDNLNLDLNNFEKPQ